MDDSKLETLRDLKKFAPKFLVIRTKAGNPRPFTFNRAQEYVHQKLEYQLKETGKVRAILLKGRQQGMSTLIQARFFHKVITSRGKKTFILTHDKEATKNLFDMANRFYENLEPGLAPAAETSNAKELYFKEFDSGYAVGTAGNKSVGRSQTIQLLHLSEVGFYQFAEEHSKGILQAVSSENGTEVIMESTANGIGNYFHQRWMMAVGGQSEYQAIFVPWYWQPEYTSDAAGLSYTEDEQYLIDMYGQDGLTKEHIAWRRIKIADLSKDYDAGLEFFRQEFPFSSQESFKNPIANVFINSRHVVKARENRVDSTHGNLIIGVDVAISDRDRTAIIRRKGRVAYNLELVGNLNTMEVCGKLKHIILKEKPFRVYVDCIGVGAGVVDRMNEMGFDCVEGINVARSANNKETFRNLRAELWSEMRDWLTQEMPVQIPDSDTLHSDLCSLGYKFTSNGQLQIESKDDLRARGMPSCDAADALMLTMAGGYFGVQQMIEVPQKIAGEDRMFR